MVTSEPIKPILPQPLQFKTQISADLKAQNKALEPQKLEKGIIAPQTVETGLKRDLGADTNRIQPTTQALVS